LPWNQNTKLRTRSRLVAARRGGRGRVRGPVGVEHRHAAAVRANRERSLLMLSESVRREAHRVSLVLTPNHPGNCGARTSATSKNHLELEPGFVVKVWSTYGESLSRIGAAFIRPERRIAENTVDDALGSATPAPQAANLGGDTRTPMARPAMLAHCSSAADLMDGVCSGRSRDLELGTRAPSRHLPARR